VDDLAVLIDGHLTLERVRLLLARVVGPLPALGPLHPLLERIDHHSQPRGVAQQRRQGLALVLAGVGQPHGVLALRLQDRQAAADGAQGGGVGGAEEVAQRLLRRVLAEPNDGQQELVRWCQVEGITAAERAPAVGAIQAAAVGAEGCQQAGQHLVEGRDSQAGQGPKDGRVPAQVFTA
jgi:hypothetical protein